MFHKNPTSTEREFLRREVDIINLIDLPQLIKQIFENSQI